jgi:hypothetical protein
MAIYNAALYKQECIELCAIVAKELKKHKCIKKAVIEEGSLTRAEA